MDTVTSPIKLKSWSRNGQHLMTFIVIGLVPDNIISHLKHFNKTGKLSKNAPKDLSEYYGKTWQDKLNITRVKGGNDQSDADFDEFSFNVSDADADDESDFDFDYLLGDSIIEDIPPSSYKKDSSQRNSNKSHRNPMTPTGNTVFVFDIFLSKSDTILTMKKKISIITKIPLYKLYLWTNVSGEAKSVSYELSINNVIFPPKPSELFRIDGDQVEGMPFDKQLYINKESIEIFSTDEITPVDFYIREGVTQFNFVSLDDYLTIGTSTLSTIHGAETIYYGFIVKYWPMITVDVFKVFIKDRESFSSIYPELDPDISKLSDIFDRHHKMNMSIVKTLNDKKNKIAGMLSRSITHTSSRCLLEPDVSKKIIFLNRLFDILKLSNNIPYARLIYSEDGLVNDVFTKVYNSYNSQVPEQSLESLTLRIVGDSSAYLSQEFTFVIFSNGNYLIIADWDKYGKYEYSDIHKIQSSVINPIISKINTYVTCFSHTSRLFPVDRHSMSFGDISVQLVFAGSMGPGDFTELEKNMRELESLNIFQIIESDQNSISSVFTKSIDRANFKQLLEKSDITNTYGHLSNPEEDDKWLKFVVTYPKIVIDNTGEGIQVSIIRLTEASLVEIYNIFIYLFNKSHNQNNKSILYSKQSNVRKLLNKDPALYDLKKRHNINIDYSRKCQSRFQPKYIDDHVFTKMTPSEQRQVVKYWNFTKNSEAYYTCPSEKYPYLKFLVNEHPLGYCLPCCGKKNKSKTTMNITCMTEHKYLKEKTNKITTSTYIMTYGKTIEPGRISRLPTDTLSAILNRTSEKGIRGTSGCELTEMYYLYGVKHHTRTLLNVSMMYILIDITKMTSVELVKELETKLNVGMFKRFLGGKINNYFTDNFEFIDAISKVLMSDTSDDLLPEWYSTVDWNMVFIDLMRLIFKINVFTFVDSKSDTFLDIPKGIVNVNQLLMRSNLNVIVLKKGLIYNPIYLIDGNVFFETKLISKKVFENSYDIVSDIIKLASTSIPVFNKFDINEVRAFTTSIMNDVKDKFKLTKLFVDEENQCYGVNISITSPRRKVYLPVHPSICNPLENETIQYSPLDWNKDCGTYSDVIYVLSTYIKWAPDKLLDMSEIKWLSLDNKAIGFSIQNLNFYLSEKLPITGRMGNINKLMYDPQEVDKEIYKGTPAILSKEMSNIGHDLYKFYLYRLYVYSFYGYIQRKKNMRVRNLIKKFSNSGENLLHILHTNGVGQSDIHIITHQLRNTKTQKTFNALVGQSHYEFDLEDFTGLISKPIESIINYLNSNVKKWAVLSKPGDIKLKNRVLMCQPGMANSVGYCADGRLKIINQTAKKYNRILAADLINPIKQKIFFKSSESLDVYGRFNFIRNPNETIKHEIRLVEKGDYS
jgi:hypothetical protein